MNIISFIFSVLLLLASPLLMTWWVLDAITLSKEERLNLQRKEKE